MMFQEYWTLPVFRMSGTLNCRLLVDHSSIPPWRSWLPICIQISVVNVAISVSCTQCISIYTNIAYLFIFVILINFSPVFSNSSHLLDFINCSKCLITLNTDSWHFLLSFNCKLEGRQKIDSVLLCIYKFWVLYWMNWVFYWTQVLSVLLNNMFLVTKKLQSVILLFLYRILSFSKNVHSDFKRVYMPFLYVVNILKMCSICGYALYAWNITIY